MSLKTIEKNKSTLSLSTKHSNNKSAFKDLEPLNKPVEIIFDIKNNTKDNSIVFTDHDPFLEELFEKLEHNKKLNIKQKNKIELTEKNTLSLENVKIGLLERAGNFIKQVKNNSKKESSVPQSGSQNENQSAEKDFLNQNISVEYPGEINLASIDKTLTNPDIKILGKSDEEPEVLGVNRAKVFYNIEKQIHSTRSTNIFSKLRLKNIKKGLFLPALIALSSVVFLMAAWIVLSFYFKSISTATLEDNIIKDESILAKIAKQKDEEAKLAALKLEEERRKLEDERNRLESTINEELLKREAEIENKFLEKMKNLQISGVSENELERLKKEYEAQKEDALKNAREERDEKVVEQSREIAEKDEKLKQAVETLKKESESYESELAKIKEEFELRKVEEEKKIEQANIQIRKLQETERTIKDFNETVYKLISGAMANFKDNKLDAATTKLSEVLKYYNSRLDFVNSNDDLRNKMYTDIFFVETISSLIEESKNSVINNREYMKIINKFKKITESYQRAEFLHNEGDFDKSGKEYENILEEFNEVNVSYQRLKDIEKRKQNDIASNYYIEAIGSLEKKEYQNALSKLTTIIKETPLSDYTNQALSNIVKTAELLSFEARVSKDNENAAVVFKQAEALKESKKYNEALKLYQDVIVEYPFSDYTKTSLESIRYINSLLGSQGIEELSSNMKEKFLSDFKNYKYYYEKGDVERARIYYFEALKNAFDIYADNSISQFKKVEDFYIEDLLQNNILKSEDYYNAVLTQQNEKLKKMQEEKDILEKQLGKDQNSKLSKELDALKKKYDELEKSYEEKTLNSNEREKIKSELEKVIEEKYRLLKEKEVEEERIKIKNDFDRELLKIKRNISSSDTIESLKEGKYIARITEVIRESVTFEFITLNKYSKIKLKKDEDLQIVRLSGSGNNRQETIIGHIKVSYINGDSLYGRGVVVSLNLGMKIEKGDLLVKNTN